MRRPSQAFVAAGERGGRGQLRSRRSFRLRSRVLALEARELRKLPRPNREHGAADGPLLARQGEVALDELIEVAREALDRVLHLHERRTRQPPRDEAEARVVGREVRGEKLALHLVLEELLHGPVAPPREVARREQLEAVERQELDELRAMHADQKTLGLVLVDLVLLRDLLDRPAVDQEIREEQELRIGDEGGFLV